MAGRTTAAFYLQPATTMALLLFLLVGLAAAQTQPEETAGGMGVLLSRALATSDSECAAEIEECGLDASCVACLGEYTTKADTCDKGDGTCDDAQSFFCCTIEDEDEGCENDTAFSNFIECLVEVGSPECGDNFVDLSDCSGAPPSLALSRSVPGVLSFTAVAGLLVAAFGFFVV